MEKRSAKKWQVVGWMGLVGAFGIMAYYMVIGGWVLNYIAQISFGLLDLSHIVSFEQTSAFYEQNIVSNPLAISFATLVLFWLITLSWCKAQLVASSVRQNISCRSFYLDARHDR